MGKATDFKFGQNIQGIPEHKPIKNVAEKAAWAYLGTAQFFE